MLHSICDIVFLQLVCSIRRIPNMCTAVNMCFIIFLHFLSLIQLLLNTLLLFDKQFTHCTFVILVMFCYIFLYIPVIIPYAKLLLYALISHIVSCVLQLCKIFFSHIVSLSSQMFNLFSAFLSFVLQWFVLMR